MPGSQCCSSGVGAVCVTLLLPAAKPHAAASFRHASAAPPCLSSTAACAPPLHIIRLPAAWGALLGRRLSQRGVLVFCLDYRNFPQAS